ncbi:thioredoxin-dependent thiol peroxidase [Cochlodiniinecator piscidefendens]|uniref:thioredoxin-dependent thiol peroxidase n=1 Tax=Cochlodiniinecator piscidefendens TaxID=2715756 RepID=UPI0014092B18
MTLDIGHSAPDFTLPQDGGDPVTLSALRPSRVVLFFYPKDNTPGCTTEAIDFTNHLEEFKSLGVEIIGISKDSIRKHANFRTKHELGVSLVSDADSDTCERYGVWKEKSMYGKTFWGIERTTILIDGNGEILRIWNKVKVPGHVQDVLETVKSL